MPFKDWGPRKQSVLGILVLAMLGSALIGAELPVAVAVTVVDLTVLVAGLGAWVRWGRDPVELDDDSVLAAGPPAGLRPCLAVVLHDGRGEDRALAVALLQLAERGLIEIHDDPLVGNGAYIPRAWINVKATRAHDEAGLGTPEHIIAASLRGEKYGHVKLDAVAVVMAIGLVRSSFESAIDDELVAAGWYRRPPFRTGTAWLHLADVVVLGGAFGVGLAILTTSIPLLFAYLGLVVAGLASRRIAVAMPARTRAGAAIEAMLKAYRRSLEMTLATTESVWDVLRVRELAWFETPDRMIVWAMALDLEHDLATMFARSVARSGGGPEDTWFPDWFGTTVPDPERMFRSLDHLVGSFPA